MAPTAGLIRYRDLRAYKYVLAEPAACHSRIPLDIAVEVPGFIRMEESGVLTVLAGYAWDGPSGPAVDTATFMRASLFHDAGYQLIRAQLLGARFRAPLDALMRRIALEDGMSPFRAWYAWAGVRVGGGSAALPRLRGEDQAAILTAP